MRRLPFLAGLLVSGFLCAPLCGGSLSGRVSDAAGQPVAGARVAWYAFEEPQRRILTRMKDTDPAPLGETKTDAAGRFVVSIAKSASEISVRIFPAGLPSVEIDGPFDLTADSEDLEVLVPAPEELSGRVLDEGGKAVAGARVRAAVEGLAAEGDGVAFEEARTAADGSFVLKSAPKDASSLVIFRAGYAPLASYREAKKTGQKVFLKRGGSIEGTVVNAAKNPVAGVLVVAGAVAAETAENGSYRIEAVGEGLASVEAFGKDDQVARRDGVRVRKGEVARVDLQLARSAAIAGTVVDEKTRRPLSGARISVTDSQGLGTPPGTPQGPHAATSDGRGRFRLAGLVAREYLAVASRRDYMRSAIPNVIARIPQASASFALRKASTVSGRVQDEEGRPVAGARVAFVPGKGRRALEAAWARSRPVTASAADGTFRLRGVPPDPAVSLEATKPGFVTARRDGIPAAGESAKGVALLLRRGLRARGRVVNERGDGVAGVEVRLTRSERYEGGSFSATSESGGGRPASTTDGEGRFLVAALEPGEYKGRFSRDGFATKTLPLEVASGGEPAEWSPVVLRASAPIAGVVRNSRGEPVAGARVGSYDMGGGGYDSCLTDFEGRFRHDGYPDGANVTLFVTAEGYARAQRAAAAPAPDVTVVLSSTGTIRGRVEDDETKSPVEGFALQWHTPGPASVRIRRDFRSADGGFEISEVAPGKAEILVSAPGYLESRLAGIEVGEGGVKEGVVLFLKKGKPVTGRVLDPRSAGVANATVSWREEGTGDARGIFYGPAGAVANIPNSTTSDADGRFRYEGVPSGRLVFTASHPDYVETSKTLDTADASLDLVLSAGGSIAGQVVAHGDRAPVEGAVVSLQEQGGSRSVWSGDETRSDTSGRFQFAHLREGRYRLFARGNAGRSTSREVVLGAGERVEDALMELSGGAVIRGRITGLASGDLSSVSVTAVLKDFQSTASAGEDGQFVIRDVPPGILRLFAWAARPSGRSSSKTLEVPEGAGEIPVEIAFEAGSRLSGRILRGEKGLPGLYVSATPEPPTSGVFRGSAQTDENGRYQLEGLTDGTYRLFLSGGGFNASRTVTVSGDSTADVVLRGVSVTGVVSDADSQEPVSGASVRAQMAAGSFGASSETDSRGHYALEDLEEGSYRLTATRRGYQQKAQDLTVGESPMELDISLARGAGLVVKAADGLTGLPLRSLNVFAVSSSKTPAFEGGIPLDATGQGEIPSLAPGHYSLSLSSAGYSPRHLQVDVPSPTLVVSMTPGGRVEVRTGSAVSGRLLDAAGNPYFPSRYGPEGSVTIAPPATAWENFAPGSYVLVLKISGGEKAFPLVVAEGKTTTVEVK